MVFLVTVDGLDSLQIGLVGTEFERSTCLFEISIGVVADVYNCQMLIVIGYSMIGLGYELLAFFPRFEIILLIQACADLILRF